MLIFDCLMLFESTLLDSFSFSSRISFLNRNSWNYLSENSCFLFFFPPSYISHPQTIFYRSFPVTKTVTVFEFTRCSSVGCRVKKQAAI